MPKDYSRTERVASTIQRTLAELIRREIKDPRITGLITINEVIISKDLSNAKVYISILGSDDVDKVIEALNGAQGYLHNLLGRELSLRIVPKLHFFHDTLLHDANRMEALINRVIEDDNKEDNS